MKQYEKKRTLLSWIGFICLAVAAIVMIAPFIIVAINSFKSASDYAANGPLSLPNPLSLNGITGFWDRVDFSGKLLNSLVISLCVSVLGVLFALLTAYPLGIGKIKGRLVFLIIFIIANTLPQESLAYPIYYFCKMLKIYDTQLSVIIVFTVIQGAFGTYLLSSVFTAFPKGLLEAAKIDGCSKSQMLFKIIMPISMPTLMVLFTFFFIWTWNEFFLPLILLVSNARQTVPIAITVTQGQHNMDVTMASASALLGIIPCIIFFVLFQRTLTRGVTAGSLK